MSNSIVQAFKSLNVSSAHSVSEHETIYDVSYQYLSNIKEFNDLISFHNCLVALINLDRYHKALELIRQVPEDVHIEFVLEKAYIYYKTGNSRLLLDIYNSNDFSNNPILSRALKHILAQDYYRNGNNAKALELYVQLIQSNKEIDNSLDLSCNERAIIHQQNLMDSIDIPSLTNSSIEESYDLLFNDSLVHLSKGEYATALVLLNKAEQKCQDQSDLLHEDVLLELAPIKLTIAYIYQFTNKTEEALKILKELELEPINDLIVKLILSNNHFSITGKNSDNLNFMHRELNYQYNLHHLQQKLTKPQYHVLVKNHLLLSFFSGSLSNKSSYLNSKSINQWLDDFPGDYTPVMYKVLIKLGIDINDISNSLNHKQISKKLFKFVSANNVDQQVIAATLLLVFINSKQNRFDQSMIALEKISNYQFDNEKVLPGLIGILIKLYEQLNLTKNLEALFSRLVEHFTGTDQKLIKDDINYYDFVKIIGFKLLILQNESSSKLFSLLNKVNPDDELVSTVLNNSSPSNLSPISKLTSSTPSVDELLATSIETLIPIREQQKPITKLKPAVNKVTKKTRKPKFSSSKVVKPEAEFNPESLDKERWLPMKVRSYYKPSKKELKKKLGGHQGAVETQSAAPVTASNATNTSSNKNKKKKKKGKK
ncbi:uncharacterized protein AC631_03863 [Debaryomyces fabryi]|uniref:Signal recognition particle subunit SRP72 n=1 Tax=Debaryomyces fabryi TaxID=58627 RepID=A0A0V1PVW7_9ASCO|nr:uncharacterized protein AC631_03863 [Debaryomyces fabryi]KSA00391.1 hypothetical protein AC631_03863 [Debaryomyces fabryi]CUM52314.1 unnamed protein product [Debaryomyces fabryi]